jgi:hypothetical protein
VIKYLNFSLINFLEKKRELVLQFFTVRLYMCANQKSSLDDYFTNDRIIVVINKVTKTFSMSKKEFQRMHQHFRFYIQQYDLLNKVFESFVCINFFRLFILMCSIVNTGRLVVADEKKKECPSYYKYARCPKGIWCHWITELAVCFLHLSYIYFLFLKF